MIFMQHIATKILTYPAVKIFNNAPTDKIFMTSTTEISLQTTPSFIKIFATQIGSAAYLQKMYNKFSVVFILFRFVTYLLTCPHIIKDRGLED